MTSDEVPLRAARMARGWSQARAADELALLARERGLAVAAPASLKTQLSRWENQHVVPEEQYRALLREMYGRTDDELGLAPSAGYSEIDDAAALRAELAAAAALDEPAITLLRSQLRTAQALDDRLGAVAVAGSAHAQLSHLERALAHAVHRSAQPALAGLVAEAAMLAGRIELDLGRPAAAWRHHETARKAGLVAQAGALVAYAMVEQAGVLIDVGNCDPAVDLIEQAASRIGNDAPPSVRAWMAAREGDALAAAGAEGRARRAYQEAERLIAAPRARIDMAFTDLMIDFDHGALHRHRGHSLRVLRDDESAIADLEQALHGDGGSVREIAGVHVDLAYAFEGAGQRAAASKHARTARELAIRIGSTRLTAQLDEATRLPDQPVRARTTRS